MEKDGAFQGRLRPIAVSKIVDEHRTLSVKMRFPMIQWPGQSGLPIDVNSREYKEKVQAAVEGFFDELDGRLESEECSEFLRLGCMVMLMHQLETSIPKTMQNQDQGVFCKHAGEYLQAQFLNWKYRGVASVPPEVDRGSKGKSKTATAKRPKMDGSRTSDGKPGRSSGDPANFERSRRATAERTKRDFGLQPDAKLGVSDRYPETPKKERKHAKGAERGSSRRPDGKLGKPDRHPDESERTERERKARRSRRHC